MASSPRTVFVFNFRSLQAAVWFVTHDQRRGAKDPTIGERNRKNALTEIVPYKRYAMPRDTTVIAFRQPDNINDPLTELAREGARRMLAQVLVAEADAFVAMWKDLKLPDGRAAQNASIATSLRSFGCSF